METGNVSYIDEYPELAERIAEQRRVRELCLGRQATQLIVLPTK